ncbi:hypothetical protein [Aureispira anguillae]|uniref:Uncharacterized protein n=1 Tax=Aureispira anguillae TaxID=2864201 RepID=A0A915YH42_9BACT|nr:hypothetical protein [Aureispira anguillae]BDS12968.1 hypothetical protein AsAng_0036960 [Aureispira anguillae]
MDSLVKQLQSEIREEKPQETRVETTFQTEPQTESQTIPQTEVETANTAQKQIKTAEKQDSTQASNNAETIEKKTSNNVSDNSEKTEEKTIEEEEDPLWDYMMNEDKRAEEEEEEEEEDPLLNSIEGPEDRTVEEQIEESTGESQKNLDTLASLGVAVMDYLDNSKAQLCAAIGGKEAAFYASDTKAKKALINATKNYIQEIGIKPPSPTQTFLIAVGMWLLPSLSLAGFQRFKLIREGKNKPSITPNTAENLMDQESIGEQSEEEQPAPAVDYTTTKEYQSGRRLFGRHANGTYRRLSDGEYANVDLADEYPSAELLALLEKGYSNAEIREIIYGE